MRPSHPCASCTSGTSCCRRLGHNAPGPPGVVGRARLSRASHCCASGISPTGWGLALNAPCRFSTLPGPPPSPRARVWRGVSRRFGVYLSLVEHYVRDVGVAGYNTVTTYNEFIEENLYCVHCRYLHI